VSDVSDTETLLELRQVNKRFVSTDHREDIVVLKDVDFSLRPGEIVAMLGRSGCGKSTLLRIICGLTPASDGRVLYRGQPVTRPMAGISMVFQTFGLFPWLTVLENVELGLEAQDVPAAERRQRALAAIDMIGLDGFESAYPKELSGGMRQRVGFRPRSGGQSRRAADGRGVFGAGCADFGNLARRPAGFVAGATDSDSRHPDGVAQHRGGADDRRPGGDPGQQSGDG
jgi:ABC-type nitrate/sulfonate/bicarbonate transport system ATPase subunit